MPAPADLHRSVGNLNVNTTEQTDPPKTLPPPPPLCSSSYAPQNHAATATGTATTAPATTAPTSTVQPPLKRRREEDDTVEATAPAEDTLGDRERMPLPPYKSKVRVLEKYHIIGFISSGTYGRVYKARSRTSGNKKEFAIKKQENTFPAAVPGHD